jgi:glucan phosphorylase
VSYLWENGLGKLKSDFDYVTHTVMAVQVITFDMEMDSTLFDSLNIFGHFQSI